MKTYDPAFTFARFVPFRLPLSLRIILTSCLTSIKIFTAEALRGREG